MKRINLKLTLAILFSLMSTLGFAQGTITGKVVDSKTQEALIGASVAIPGKSVGSVTGVDGHFKLELKAGTYKLIASYIGYLKQVQQITVENGQTVDLGTIALAPNAEELGSVVVTGSGVIDMAEDRKTPIAVSSIPATEIEARSAGNVEFPMVMKNTPSVYVSGQGGGFGDSEMFLRGFDQSNTAFLFNGQPINGMEDGKMYWSNWAGVTDIANAVQVQRGLGSSKLAISSVGGTVNIVTKTTDLSEGGYVRILSGNGGYAKATASYSTGMNAKGWGMTFMLDYWRADRKFAEGTRGKGQSYFLSVGKKAGNSTFNFMIVGSPQWHDQNYTKPKVTEYNSDGSISTPGYDILGKKGNSNMGFLNGEYLSLRTNYYHKPILNLNWDWKISDQSSLSTVLYASFGRGGGTGNYGTSPGYISETYGGGYDPETGHIAWDNIVAYNETISGGYSNGYNGMLLRSSVNRHNWYGLITNYESKLSDQVTVNGGADFRFYKGTHYRELVNLLGLTGREETVSGEDRYITETYKAKPWAAFKDADQEDRIDYDYDELINYQGVFGQIEWSNNQFSAFFQGAASMQSYKGVDRYNFDYEKESDWVNKFGFNLKGGASYKFTDNTLFVNAGYYSRQPFRDNIFSNYDDETEYDSSVDNEHILGLEAGYKLELGTFRLNLNGYYTKWNNRFLSNSGSDYEVDGTTYTDVDYLFKNIGEIHKGLELDLRYRPYQRWLIKGYASLGDWKYDGSSPVNVRDENSSEVVDNLNVDLTGAKIGSAPQTSFGLSTRYDLISNKLTVNVDWNQYSRLYAEVDASDVADAALEGEDYESEEINHYALFDAGFNYKFMLGKQKFTLVGNVYNLLNNEYFTEKDSYGYMYGNGTTWNCSIRYRF